MARDGFIGFWHHGSTPCRSRSAARCGTERAGRGARGTRQGTPTRSPAIAVRSRTRTRNAARRKSVEVVYVIASMP